MKAEKVYGLDIETDDPFLANRGASWVYGAGSVIVTGVCETTTGKKRALAGAGGKIISSLLQTPGITLVGANIVYDLGWLCYAHGIPSKALKCRLIDVSIVEQFIDEYQPYSLDALAWKYLRERKGAETLAAIAASRGLRGDFRRHLKALWDAGFQDEIKEYVISDADQPVRIWEKQQEIIEAQNLTPALEMNLRLIPVVLGMKQRGVRIDMPKWKRNSAKLDKVFNRLEKDFAAKYGQVNLNSPKQLAELFKREKVPFKYRIVIKGFSTPGVKFTKASVFQGDEIWRQREALRSRVNGLRVQKGKLCLYAAWQYAARTADEIRAMGYEVTCNPNIDKFCLGATKKSYPVSGAVQEIKQVKNIIDKFLGPNLERFIVDGRIHADFNIVGARRTARFSSSNPNLQNIPSKTVLYEGTEQEMNLAEACRELFLPEPGEVLVKLDFSGQENRLQAHFAWGKHAAFIRRKYNEDPDFDEHQFVADVSGLAEEHGEKIGRKLAKQVRFGRSYGMQLITMMENFGWGKEFTEELIAQIEQHSPWFVDTMKKVQERVLERRYIQTLLGRRVHLRNGRDRDAYKFYNYLIQGSAADMTKAATVRIAETETVEKLLLTVHDENVFSVPRTAAGMKRVLELQDCMEHAVTLTVPIICEPEIGADWYHVDGPRKSKKTGKKESVEAFLRRKMGEQEVKRGKQPV